MAVHPNLTRALLIGYGVGNTAKALTDSRSLETIDVVDVSRDILRMSNVIYPDEADRPLDDPRVRVHIEDGRSRFQDSPLIKHLWPERLRAASLSYFEFQDTINAHLYVNRLQRPNAIQEVHRLLTRSSLRS